MHSSIVREHNSQPFRTLTNDTQLVESISYQVEIILLAIIMPLKRYPKNNSTLAQCIFCIKEVCFFSLSAYQCNSVKLITMTMFNNHLVKILILQHLPHRHFYKAYKKSLDNWTHYPSDQFVLGWNKLQQKYHFLAMNRNSNLKHSNKSEIIKCVA